MISRLKNCMKKMNNKGSSLVIVIIVISFVCILGTLLLYLSVMNYQMKSNDYKTRVSFYGSEEPLEELRVQLAADMSAACEKAYIDVMVQYSSLVTSDMRSSKYNELVLEELESIWNGRTGGGGGATADWVVGINAALYNNSDYHVMSGNTTTMPCAVGSSCTCPYHIIVLDMGTEDRLVLDDVKGQAVLNDIKVFYTENEFTSVVTTDFCMVLPEYNWNMQQNINVAANADPSRTKIDYEKCVVYLNYTKQ